MFDAEVGKGKFIALGFPESLFKFLGCIIDVLTTCCAGYSGKFPGRCQALCSESVSCAAFKRSLTSAAMREVASGERNLANDATPLDFNERCASFTSLRPTNELRSWNG